MTPEVMIRYSDDGGRTWSHEMWHELPDAGSQTKRIQLYSQGASPNRIYELTFTDERSFTIIEANADIREGGW